jgi:phosphatidylglycerophosphate synthase
MTAFSAYDPAVWHDFFEATAGASATLSGLIFVGVSINVRAILTEEKKLGSRSLTGRALESLVDLLVVLAISFVGLVPGISGAWFAVYLLFSALVCAVSPWRFIGSYLRTKVKPVALGLRIVLTSILVAALLVAGITTLLGVGGGLDWLPFAFVLAVSGASVNAWVLTVEILR